MMGISSCQATRCWRSLSSNSSSSQLMHPPLLRLSDDNCGAVQDSGLLRFRASSLAYRRMEYSSRKHCLSPEGVVFGHDSMYCAM
jgi:hypothetical protein